jgi:hypothetical protein
MSGKFGSIKEKLSENMNKAKSKSKSLSHTVKALPCLSFLSKGKNKDKDD